jgi:hypothetical protein
VARGKMMHPKNNQISTRNWAHEKTVENHLTLKAPQKYCTSACFWTPQNGFLFLDQINCHTQKLQKNGQKKDMKQLKKT